MTQVGFEPKVRLNILGEQDIAEIHAAGLRILEEIGVGVHSPAAIEILRGAGCAADSEGIVKFPARLVEQALGTVPSSVTLYTRNGEVSCPLGGWRTSFGTGSDCPFILDRDSGRKRLCTYDDVHKGAIVCDSLEHFNFVMPVGIISDRPRHVADVHALEATLRGTEKPVVFTAHNAATFQAGIDLAATAVGGAHTLRQRPCICLYAEPTSPLKHMQEATEKLMTAARQGIPVIFTPCPLMGATAPATRAGALAQAVAESFSGLVLHQLVNSGAPFIFGAVMNVLDMSTTIAPYGSPELHQMCAALTDMAHHYQLPMFGTCGCSDAKQVDAQAGLEVGFSVLTATLNGQNLIHDIGFLESALITSYEMYILSNEAIGMAKYIAGGVPVNQETLALDVIREVGQHGDHLVAEHTLRHFRNEFFFPNVMDRKNYAGWEAGGGKGMDRVLREAADEILNSHQTVPLSAAADKGIRDILGRLDA